MLIESVSNSDTAARHDIITRRGDTFTRRITFNQVVDGVSTPEDLTGNTFSLRVIRRQDSRKTPVLSFDPGDITMPDPGVITFGKTAEQMDIPAGSYWYDLQQTHADGTVRTRLAGDFRINQDVTP